MPNSVHGILLLLLLLACAAHRRWQLVSFVPSGVPRTAVTGEQNRSTGPENSAKQNMSHIVRVQEVEAARDVQRDRLPAAVPPQLSVRVIIQCFPQVAALQPVLQPSGIYHDTIVASSQRGLPFSDSINFMIAAALCPFCDPLHVTLHHNSAIMLPGLYKHNSRVRAGH